MVSEEKKKKHVRERSRRHLGPRRWGSSNREVRGFAWLTPCLHSDRRVFVLGILACLLYILIFIIYILGNPWFSFCARLFRCGVVLTAGYIRLPDCLLACSLAGVLVRCYCLVACLPGCRVVGLLAFLPVCVLVSLPDCLVAWCAEWPVFFRACLLACKPSCALVLLFSRLPLRQSTRFLASSVNVQKGLSTTLSIGGFIIPLIRKRPVRFLFLLHKNARVYSTIIPLLVG